MIKTDIKETTHLQEIYTPILNKQPNVKCLRKINIQQQYEISADRPVVFKK